MMKMELISLRPSVGEERMDPAGLVAMPFGPPPRPFSKFFMYCLYILKSLSDNKSYVGTTKNLQKRLHQHNSGQVKSTKHRIPFIVVYSEKFETLSEARKKEWFYKCTPQGGKLKKKILKMA